MRFLFHLIGLGALAATGWYPARAETAGGIRWTAPGGWKAQPPRPMRAATYVVPAAAGDREDAECVAYYFGAGQGGGVEDNVNRWLGQFQEAEARSAAKRSKQTFAGLPGTIVDVSGTYTGAGGPMAAAKTAKPGYRMLAAIVEAPEAPVFFKFTGPAKTVAAHLAAFHSMLKSVTR